MFNKILVCSDGSDRSLDAARYAAELTSTHHAALTLLHVCPLPMVNEAFPGAATLAQSMVDQYVRDLHHAVMERTVPVINGQGVFCDTLTETGDPVAEITRIAENRGFDLIVLGSRGMTVERASRLGSVSYGVLHQAPCPVLLVSCRAYPDLNLLAREVIPVHQEA